MISFWQQKALNIAGCGKSIVKGKVDLLEGTK